jgi:hypothetical protein
MAREHAGAGVPAQDGLVVAAGRSASARSKLSIALRSASYAIEPLIGASLRSSAIACRSLTIPR